MRSPFRSSAVTIGAWMAITVSAVAALAYWDEQRESAAALGDFAQEQATLAASVAGQLANRLALTPEAPIHDLLSGARRLERPNALVVFVAPPWGGLLATDGRAVEAPSLTAAIGSGRSTVRLGRSAAAPLGLPERTALAGISHAEARGGSWGVAVVASAERERDRERWARARLILSTLLAAGLVVGFGGFALRRQRAQLELERELAVAEVERERDARLARLSRAATMLTLASGVAHEISTPLGVISGRAEQLLLRAGEDERARRAAQGILEQAQRVKDVIGGLLDLARGGGPALQEVPPSSVVEAAVALVAHRFEKAGVRLAAGVPSDLAPIRCDPTLLEHALVNLLLNACDACARGGAVEITARLEGGALTFVVEDDGEGIAQVNAARATEPFFTTKPRGRGTGLGLAVVSEIAKCHRGSFSIEPGSPRGTRARIRLPAAEGGAS
ncbi:MAG TPA: HAMP domain-containing sensor histidine kinase [Anaeromyxobacteraceae bacterium]